MWGSCLHFGLSFAMAIHPLNSLEMPLLASAFASVLPRVICAAGPPKSPPSHPAWAIAPQSVVHFVLQDSSVATSVAPAVFRFIYE